MTQQWFYVTIDAVSNRSEADAEREVGRPPDRRLGPVLMWRSTDDEAPEWVARLNRLGYLARTGFASNGMPV